MPRFDPFLLFRGLRHRGRIQSLPFVSGSPASCLDSILFFISGSPDRVRASLIFFDIASVFFLIFLGIVSEHRLSFSASHPAFFYLPRHRVRASLIFFGIASDFLLSSLASCSSNANLFWYRFRLSLIFLSIVSEHRLSFLALRPTFIIFSSIVSEHRLSFSASSPTFIIFSGIFPNFPHLPRHRVQASLIFFGIASGFLLSLLALRPNHSSSQASFLGFS